MNLVIKSIRHKNLIKNNIQYMIFIAGAGIVYTLFFVIPNISTIFNSFFEWESFLTPNKVFVGLKNYSTLFGDKNFWQAFGNTISYTFGVVFGQYILALLFAVLIRQKTKLNNIFRTVYFLPYIFSTVTVGFIWGLIYDPNIGPLNAFLNSIGLESLARPWLADPALVIYVIAFVQVWQGTGYAMVILLAGLQNIPVELYECADLDGAGPFRKFISVTFPLLASTSKIVLVLITIGGFKAFDFVYVLTGGMPSSNSEVLATLLYKEGFEYGRIGYSSAVSMVLLLIITAFTVIQLNMNRED